MSHSVYEDLSLRTGTLLAMDSEFLISSGLAVVCVNHKQCLGRFYP
jgi:hypothetical protein